MSAGKEIISLTKVTKDYPMGDRQFRALNEVDLSMNAGEFAGLVGPSGSGKTTLLNIIGSLDVPTSGKALVLGEDIGTLSHKASAKLRSHKIGFIFQVFNLLPVYTVFENVEFPLLIQKQPDSMRKKAVEEALEWVGLSDLANKKPSKLSGGEGQRVAIARAMVKKPDLVLADEPTANLDAANAHVILEMMAKLNRELGTTFLFSTHDEKVMSYLRRMIKLEDGAIVSDEIQTPTRS